MQMTMNCLLIFVSGFMTWQFLVILTRGYWQCHLDFVFLTLFSLIALTFSVIGLVHLFSKSKLLSFHEGMISTFVFALSFAGFIVEILPAWINKNGIIYGHEPNIVVLLAELVFLSGICVFGVGSLVYDLRFKKNYKLRPCILL